MIKQKRILLSDCQCYIFLQEMQIFGYTDLTFNSVREIADNIAIGEYDETDAISALLCKQIDEIDETNIFIKILRIIEIHLGGRIDGRKYYNIIATEHDIDDPNAPLIEIKTYYTKSTGFWTTATFYINNKNIPDWLDISIIISNTSKCKSKVYYSGYSGRIDNRDLYSPSSWRYNDHTYNN